jgi:hypothetical protein
MQVTSTQWYYLNVIHLVQSVVLCTRLSFTILFYILVTHGISDISMTNFFCMYMLEYVFVFFSPPLLLLRFRHRQDIWNLIFCYDTRLSIDYLFLLNKVVTMIALCVTI